MELNVGTIKLQVQLTTSVGGPIILGEGTIDLPVRAASTREGATLTIDQDVLRHEIAGALMDAARAFESESPVEVGAVEIPVPISREAACTCDGRGRPCFTCATADGAQS